MKNSKILDFSLNRSVILLIVSGTMLIIATVIHCLTIKRAFSFALLCLASLLIFFFAAASFFLNTKNSMSNSLKTKLMFPSVFLILSVWGLRFAVGLVNPELDSLSDFEQAGNAFVHALQTFSMDEDYTDYINVGKEFIYSNFGKYSDLLAPLYGFFATCTNTLAPIAGGAIIFDILSNIFPEIKLLAHSIPSKRERYIFAELNEMSITLAESIHETKRRPIIIFANSYLSSDEEKNSELYIRAKNINALCVKDDINSIKTVSKTLTEYFLIERQEESNMHKLAELTANEELCEKWKISKETNIFVFANDELVDIMADKINNEFNKDDDSFNEDSTGKVLVKVVRAYENVVYDTLNDSPIFLPLLERKTAKQELSILLVGGGRIGKQFLKSAYWCGQMLNPKAEQNSDAPSYIRLDFHIISNNASFLESQLKLEMPAVFDKNSDTVYASFKFENADISSAEFIEKLKKINNIDYALVALGDDRLNIAASKTIKQYLDNNSLLSESHSIINCIVENDNLKNIAEKTLTNDIAPATINITGSLKERFSYDNIKRPELEKLAIRGHIAYSKNNGFNNPLTEFYGKSYSRKSSIASTLHFGYKLYSAGLISSKADIENTAENKAAKYLKFAEYLEKQENRALMSWCEKRRWNAYLTTTGKRAPTVQEIIGFCKQYQEINPFGKGKYSIFNVHPCIVNCPGATGVLISEVNLKGNEIGKKMKTILSQIAADDFSFSQSALSEDMKFNSYAELKDMNLAYSDFLFLLFNLAVDNETVIEHKDKFDSLDILSLLLEENYKTNDNSQVISCIMPRLTSDMHNTNLSDDELKIYNTALCDLKQKYMKYMNETDGYLKKTYTHLISDIDLIEI